MKYIIIISLFIFCFQDCDSCKTTGSNCETTFHFEIPLFITPSNDTIKVGDTLTLISLIPGEMNDLNTGKLINVLDFTFNLRSTINRMDIEGGPDAEYDFEIINKVGEQIILPAGPYYTSLYSYFNSNQEKKLEIELIAKKPGLYQIVFSYLTEDLIDVSLTDSECIENLEITNNMNNGSDNNIHLLEGSPNPLDTPEGIKRDGGYAFVVIE